VQNGSVATDGQTFSNKVPREYQVRALGTSEFARWDDFVRQSPQGTLFHTTLWLDAAGLPYRLLGCFRGNDLHGGFALSLVGDRAAGRPHPSLTPYLGIMYPPPRAKYVTEISHHKEIGIAFAKFIKNEFDFLELTFSPEVIDLQPFIWQGFEVDLHYTYRLSLESLEAVLDNMDAPRRRNLLNAEKQGVQVEVGDNFAQILRLREMTFKRQGMAASDGSAAIAFESALRHAGHCQGFLARSKEGEPLGGVWIAWDDKRAYYLLGGFDRSAQSNNAVALAMWRAIQFTALDLKLPEFDFEGSMIPTIERFFRKFGGKITPNYTIRYRRPVGLGWRVARKLVRIVSGRG
jgi:hypothetical protein